MTFHPLSSGNFSSERRLVYGTIPEHSPEVFPEISERRPEDSIEKRRSESDVLNYTADRLSGPTEKLIRRDEEIKRLAEMNTTRALNSAVEDIGNIDIGRADEAVAHVQEELKKTQYVVNVEGMEVSGFTSHQDLLEFMKQLKNGREHA